MKTRRKVRSTFFRVVVVLLVIAFIGGIVFGAGYLIWLDIKHMSQVRMDFSKKPGLIGRMSNFLAGYSGDYKRGKRVLSGTRIELNGRKYGTLTIKAESAKWEPDTSIGYEIWEQAESYGKPSPHSAVVFKDGKLFVIYRSLGGENTASIPINNWEEIKDKINIFRFVWKKNSVRFYIDGKLQAQYVGQLVPDRGLRIRLNADHDHDDQLTIYKISSLSNSD